MNKSRGYFIVFEGVDKCGKSTQLKMCADALKKLGYHVVTTSEPTDGEKGPIGMIIRDVLRHKMNLKPLNFQVLFTADRIWHIKNIIVPALNRNAVVLCDRYFYSTIAYGSLDVDCDLLVKMNSKMILPDQTLFFDVNIEKIAKRLEMAGGREFFEKKEKLAKIAEAYKTIVPRYHIMTRVDGNGTIEKVHICTMNHVLHLLGHDVHQLKLFKDLRPSYRL